MSKARTQPNTRRPPAPVRLSSLIRDPELRARFRRSEDDGSIGAQIDPRRPVGDPSRAVEILHAITSDGSDARTDVLGESPRGGIYLLMELPRHVFVALCAWGAEAEDLEENGDREYSADDIGETSADDEGEPDDDHWQDYHSRDPADMAITAKARARWRAQYGSPSRALEGIDPQGRRVRLQLVEGGAR